MIKIAKSILLTICIVAIIISSYKIYQIIIEDKKSKELNEELKNYINLDNIEQKTDIINDEPIMKIDFDELNNINKDIIGWIYSENRKINYPVAQSSNNDYYLRRLLNGKYNRAGTIFMNYKNSKDLTNQITILFGHNMKNDTMFGSIINYKKQEYYNENKNLYYFTPNANYKIELFSALTIDANSDIYEKSKFSNKDLENWTKKSYIKSDINVTEEDKIMILSTCSYEYENSRFILLSKITLLE